MQFFREKYKTGVRRPPEDGGIFRIPREYSHGISLEQALLTEVSADRKQTLFLRSLRGRKRYFVRQESD
jgi:hypothetical protein